MENTMSGFYEDFLREYNKLVPEEKRIKTAAEVESRSEPPDDPWYEEYEELDADDEECEKVVSGLIKKFEDLKGEMDKEEFAPAMKHVDGVLDELNKLLEGLGK
jgi:hypothetical protein